MSAVVSELDVDWISITLNKRDGSGTLTCRMSTEFYDSNDLYSGSSPIYPLLVRPPQLKRGAGNTTGIRYDVNIDIYSKTYFTEYGKSFVDLLEEYQIHGAAVTCYYITKPVDVPGTTNNTAQTLECIDLDYDEGSLTCTLRCRDTWFKDKQFGRKFIAEDFADEGTGLVASQWVGEMQPVPFGEDEDGVSGVVISSCPMIKNEIINNAGDIYNTIRLLVANLPNDFALDAATILYVRNPYKDLDPREWLPCFIENFVSRLFSLPTAGPTVLVNGTAFGGYQWRFARLLDPGADEAMLISGCTARVRRVGTIAAGAGQLQIRIQKAIEVSTNNWATVGPTLAVAQVDPIGVSTSESNVNFYFDPPVVLPPNHLYFVILEWTNSQDTTNYIETRYNSAVTTDPTYSNDQTAVNEGWAATAAQAQIQVWSYFSPNSSIGGSITADYTAWGYDLTSTAAGGNTTLFKGVDFKVAVNGVLDDIGGTYTGTGFSRFEKPIDIMHFILREPLLGLGLASGDVDSSAITSVRSSEGTFWNLGFVYESNLSCEQILQKLCRQARVILYKLRNGKISVYYPAWSSVPSTALSEGLLHGDLQLINVVDTDYNDTVNYLECVYEYDSLQQNTDPALLRISRDQKFLGLEYTYGNDSGFSVTDPARIAKAAASEALYGQRPLLLRADLHNRASTARRILNYLGDRYSFVTKKTAFRVLRSKWYSTIDLFYNLSVQHTGIHTRVGSSDKVKNHTNGTPLQMYQGGRPINDWSGGQIVGRVVQIAEEGPWMTLIIEEENSY